MTVWKVADWEIKNANSNDQDPEYARLSDIPKDEPLPTTCPECGRVILGCLATYEKGVTCITCGCSFRYAYQFPLHA